jgi:hypothetical protein
MNMGSYKFVKSLLHTSARRMGVHIAAGRGSGKSRLMGRIIAFLDFLRGVPTVIVDPHGGTIDNFLDRMMRLPQKYQEKLWKRVVYVDMSGHWEYVVPFPFYYRFGGESFFELSQRYLDVVYKLDSYLQTASVQGWNPLWLTGTNIGMVLSALNLQISEAQELMNNPGVWKHKLEEVRSNFPELSPSVAFLLELADMKPNELDRLTSSLINKIALFSFDPITKAMVGASLPGINWENVCEQRKIVLLDFRYIKDRVRKQFFMEWALHYFLDFVLHRGPGRQLPISLIIDELAALFSIQGMTPQIFEADLDNLINVISRQYSLWLTVCHQEHFQLPETVNKSLMGLGIQVLGVTRDREAAKALAEYFYRYNPYLVRKYVPVWMANILGPYIVDYTSDEFTPDEQILLNSYRFTDLKRFEFLVSTALDEGSVSADLFHVSLESFDQGFYPQKNILEDARRQLMMRSGRPVHTILAEIEKRQYKLLSSENAHIDADMEIAEKL